MPSTESTSLRRFFVTLPEPVSAFPAALSVSEDSLVRHIRSVLRLNKGAEVVLVDQDRGQLYRAVIEAVEKSAIAFQLEEILPIPAESSAYLPEVILGAALIKEQRWDWLLQKTTELGVRTLVPLMSERTVIQVKDAEKKRERWQAIVQSAAEQSEGLFVPRVEVPMTVAGFTQWLSQQAESGGPLHKFVLQERDAQGQRHTLKSKMANMFQTPGTQTQSRLAFSVGPEGGWTAAEIALMSEAGFQPVSLGGRILRSETAAVSLMGALAYEYDTHL